MSKGKVSHMVNSTFSVDISAEVIERIAQAVSLSHVEIGGKLIGQIRTYRKLTTFNVVSYLDAGPNVSQSESHLIPDGDYQEALFRVIESLDPVIEHIGSWHSHHCNGLKRLSGGDVEGYVQNVNDPQYNCDAFLALLITGLGAGNLECRYWAFTRGSNHYVEIPPEQITIINEPYRMEGLLHAAEECVNLVRRVRPLKAKSTKLGPLPYSKKTIRSNASDKMVRNEVAVKSDPNKYNKQKLIRGDDNLWITQHYPGSRALVNKKNGAVLWRWEESIGSNQLLFKFEHPADDEIDSFAIFLATVGSGEIIKRQIKLDETRYNQLEEAVNLARDIATHKNQLN